MSQNNQDALVLVLSRNAFFRQLHFLALGVLLLSIIANAILCVVVFFFLTNPTKPRYFAADEIGRLINITSLATPNMSLDEVQAWAVEAIQRAYSYDYVNYPGQMQAAQKYFTDYGWSTFMKALVASNNLVALKDRKMVFVARVVGPPKVLAQGILNGAYAYKLQYPVLVTNLMPPYNDKAKFYNAWQVTLVITRQPLLQSYKGLGIVQIITSVAENNSNPVQEISATPTT